MSAGEAPRPKQESIMSIAKRSQLGTWMIRTLAPLALVAAAPAAHASLAISAAPTNNVTCSGGTCTATATDAVLNANDLKAFLHRSDVRVDAGPAGAIAVNAALGWAQATRLTLVTNGAITVAQPVVVAGHGGVTLTTGDPRPGALAFVGQGRLDFWDASSSLIVNGQTYMLANDIASLASAIAANPSGNYALAKSYDAKGDGIYSRAPIHAYFSGRLEGLGHSISHLKIAATGYDAFQLGLIMWLDKGGVVRNLGLRGVTIATTNEPSTPAIGALAGTNVGIIANSFATGSITSTNAVTVGGLVGSNTAGFISNAHAAVKIANLGSGGWAGGLVGINTHPAAISGSYGTGAVSARGGYVMGGLVGGNFGTIVDSYAMGAVSGGRESEAGGLAGGNFGGTIQTSYATGKVSAAASDKTRIGGLIGDNESAQRILQTVWNTTTSGVGACTGYTDAGVDCSGLTTEQFKAALPTGFDPAVWGQNAAVNGGYPYLLANPPQ
jgi:hypothetical protein